MICAHAVSVTIKRFPGVESVDVSLNKGQAAVKLKADNTVKVEQLWDAIRKNGFTPKETRVVVRGALTGSKLKVSGTDQTYDLAADPATPKALDEAAKHSGETVTIDGRLLPPKDFKSPVPLLVHSLTGQTK